MKKNKMYVFVALCFILLGLISCDKNEAIDQYISGTNPVLSYVTSKTDSIDLNYLTENKEAIYLSWTNPNYLFKSGNNSQNVIYTLEIDTADANFNGKYKKEISISGDLNISYNTKQFNIVLADLKLKVNTVAKIELRLKATLNGSTATTLYSEKKVFKVRPYNPPPKVTIPDDGTLWAIGNAFASGWDNAAGNTTLVNNQKFTKLSDTKYELIINFLGGGGYKVIQKIGDWESQYHSINGEFESGTFEKKNSDPQFGVPKTAGKYKITLDFQDGTYTVVPAN